MTGCRRAAFDAVIGPFSVEDLVANMSDPKLEQFLTTSETRHWFSFGPISLLRQCEHDASTEYIALAIDESTVSLDVSAIEISEKGVIRDLLVSAPNGSTYDWPTLEWNTSTCVSVSSFQEYLDLRQKVKSRLVASQGHVVICVRRSGVEFWYVDVEPSLTTSFSCSWQMPEERVLDALILQAKATGVAVLCPVISTEESETVIKALELFRAQPVNT